MMKKVSFILIIFILFLYLLPHQSAAHIMPPPPQIKTASSFNPVGSGARALGWGAFIAVADDATAISWNPGGLIQLKALEISFVIKNVQRTEKNEFSDNPEAAGDESISQTDVNFFSIAYPFRFMNRNMIVSASYQRLYNFMRELNDVALPIQGTEYNTVLDKNLDWSGTEHTDYDQSGDLSAVGLAYCIQVIPQLSFGFTLNCWDDDMLNNEWEENHHSNISVTYNELANPDSTVLPVFSVLYNIREKYSFNGFNFNLGALWHKESFFRSNDRLSVGLVFKSPFTADITRKTASDTSGEMTENSELIENTQFNYSDERTSDEEMDMPISYGIGVAYRFSDTFTMSGDIYRTHWNDFVIRNSQGNERSPLTGKSVSESDINPTTQVRLGAEYILVNPESHYDAAVRGGIFYDPAPAQGSPDDYYGFNTGCGIGIAAKKGIIKKYVIDIAYQFRFGNDVGESVAQGPYDFSQDVYEHTLYSSIILHL